MNKHTSYDLKQMQSLPLESKIIMTQQRIRQWYDYWDGMVYVPFSGGKDSTVLKHIVENTPGVYDVPFEKEPNRFQRLKDTHPRQYQYSIGGGEMVDGKWQPNKEGLGLGHVLDYIGVKYE